MLSRKELSEELKMTERTVDRCRKLGMPCYQATENGKVWFDLDEVKRWLKKGD